MESNECPITMTSSDPEQPGSPMAILLRQIEDEYRAAQLAMSGYTSTARHDFITARMENMGTMAEQLAEMVGDKDTAMGLVLGRMQRVEASHAS